MADIVTYNSSDPIVAYRVTGYHQSVNTPDYSGEILTNPTMTPVAGVPLKYWKVSGAALAVMSQAEKDDVDAAINAALALGTPTMKLQEEFTPSGATATGGRFQCKSIDCVIDHAINTWDDYDVSFPFPVSVLSAEWVCSSLNLGDEIQVLVAPDTITGAITADVAAAATVITVQQTVIDNARVGYRIKLADGTNTDDMGRVLSIDTENLQLTMETATTNSFAAATPTYVKQTVELIPHMRLEAGRYEIGKDAVGGSYVPANTAIRVRYKNIEGTTTGKTFSLLAEYKY